MKILMVSMPSLHFFRWTEQLKDSGHEVFWFDVVDGGHKVDRINWVHQFVGWKLRWNFPRRFFFKKNFTKIYNYIQRFNERNTPTIFEQKLLEIKPDVVHSFAVQISCLPILEVMEKHKTILWTYSSWGSDMYYPNHLGINDKLMCKILNRIDYLITDCIRDFEIAKSKGFKNKYIGVFPGNGGIEYNEKLILPISERKIILIKGYQDSIGKGLCIIKAISEDIFELIENFRIVVFGANEEIVKYINSHKIFKRLNIKIYLKSNFINNVKLIKLMGASYVYIGNSISDGLPNSLIEAAGMGAFPIQSNPGNVTTELINDGQNGLLIQNPLDSQEIQYLIKRALLNSEMIEKAFYYNTKFIKNKYDREKNKIEILKMYEEIFKNDKNIYC